MKRALWMTALIGAAMLTTMPTGEAAPGDEIPGVGEAGGPTYQLSPQQMRRWIAGRNVFDRNFTLADGVGTPDMNADSCRACHQDPAMGGAGALDVNVSRFGYDNGGQGPFENLEGGQMASKLRPPPEPRREDYHLQADVFEQRQTPSILGDGLIDTIPDSEILMRQDPDDINGDGIRGVARIHMVNGQPEVGKFGWKAVAPRVGDFLRDAMGGECGITTPDDGRGFAMLSDGDEVPDPELSPRDTRAIGYFLALLGPPLRGGSTDPRLPVGEALFSTLRCDRCHVPVLHGTEGPVPLYSNLLLHNVQAAGFRGMSDPGAEVGMYQTPVLWGIGDTAPYWHDGRAETLRAAIEIHKGEARFSAGAFNNLSRDDKAALILFLKDL